MNAARLSTSPRLRRALWALREAGGEISTFELSRKAAICAVNSVVAELRANGCDIVCAQRCEGGERRFYYTLKAEPKTP